MTEFMNFLVPEYQRYQIFDTEEGDEAWHELIKKYIAKDFWKYETTKGGPGSGNWGHSGLAGTWGGSSPTKTAKFFPAPSASRYFPKDWLSPDDKAQKSIEIMKKMSGKHSSGLEVAGVVQYNEAINKKTVRFDGQIYNGDIVVGTVIVEYFPDLLIGEIKEIMLDKSIQGTGFGKRYVGHIEDILIEMGARELTLTATASVGGYFWAKAGYDFRSREGRDSVQRRLEEVWKKRYPTKKIPSVAMSSRAHAWEIAALRGHDGYKIGKEAMLGSSWFGGKVVAGEYSQYMGIDDTGYKIGKDYYND